MYQSDVSKLCGTRITQSASYANLQLRLLIMVIALDSQIDR